MKLEPFLLERFQSIWENSVPWNLAESGVHPLSVGELLALADDPPDLSEVALGYPQTNGTLDLRRTIAEMYPAATPDHIVVTNGGSEANCTLLMRLIEPGDRVIFMTPNYMQAGGLARALGAEVVSWPMRLAGSADQARWTVDLDALEGLVTPADTRGAGVQSEQPDRGAPRGGGARRHLPDCRLGRCLGHQR